MFGFDQSFSLAKLVLRARTATPLPSFPCARTQLPWDTPVWIMGKKNKRAALGERGERRKIKTLKKIKGEEDDGAVPQEVWDLFAQMNHFYKFLSQYMK